MNTLSKARPALQPAISCLLMLRCRAWVYQMGQRRLYPISLFLGKLCVHMSAPFTSVSGVGLLYRSLPPFRTL